MIIKHLIHIPLLLALGACNMETELDNQLLEDLRDAFLGTTLKLKDSDSASTSNTNSTAVLVQVSGDDKAAGWCLSEAQNTAPGQDCLGGAGPDNGWHTERPGAFTLSSGDGQKEVYLWLRKSDGEVREDPITATIVLDTTNPVVNLNPAANINAGNANPYTLSGSCSESANVKIDFGGSLYSAQCSGGLWAFSANVSGTSDGTINISVTQTDRAGNTSAPAIYTITKDSTPPALSVTSPPANSYVNIANQASLVVSGTCSEDGTVIIGGSISDSALCSGGAFSKSIDMSALADGSVGLSFDLDDAVGNSAPQILRSLTKDTTAPTVAFTSPAAGSYINNANKSAFTISGSCSENGEPVTLFGGANATCSGGSFSAAFDLSGFTDGTVSITLDQTDAAGNPASQQSISFNKDVLAPSLTQATFTSASVVNANNVTFGGSCEDGASIGIGGADTASASCVSSAWSYTTASQSVDGTYNYTFTQTDAAGNSSSVSGSWTRDATAPSVSSIVINGGDTSTGNNNVLVSFSVAAEKNDIHSFCLKYNDTSAPAIGDSCWKTLTSIGETVTNALSVTDYPFIIGAVLANYDVRVWARDEVGNISTMSNAGIGTSGTDLYTITYQPDPAPVFGSVIAVSSDTPSDPLIEADTTVTIGNDLYIKWDVSDNNPIPSGNIDLYYTTDNVNYTLIAGGLDNGANNSCTLTGSYTGCYHWVAASPTSGFYRVKVAVQDSGVSSVFSMTNSLNTGNVNFLSGNTSLGIGGSASSAILLGEGENNFSDKADPQAIAVTKTGIVFYKYKDKGLTYISPENGLLQTLLPANGSISGDGGSVFSASAAWIKRIALDYDENLLVYDNDQIRKIDLSTNPWTIDTIAGGGVNAPDGSDALAANLPSISGSIVPTPNGRIYFPGAKELWYFDPSDNKIHKYLTASGFGTGDNTGDHATYDISACTLADLTLAFDKSTSTITKMFGKTYVNTNPSCGNRAIGGYSGYNTNLNLATGAAEAPHPPATMWSSTRFTGLDGKIYNLHHGRYKMQVYDPAANAWTDVLGNGQNGRCDDGTAALSCPAYIMSAFVNEFGRIYFVDMGVIRFVDDSGLVQTLAGQPRNFGVGYNPLTARYSQVNFFDINGDDVYIKNKLENQIVKFSLAGGNLSLVAGNGIKGYPADGEVATDTKLPNCGWAMPCGIKVDPVNNRLYHHNGTNLWYIDLSTGQWVNQNYVMLESASRTSFLGYNGNKFLAYVVKHLGGSGNKVLLSEVDPNTPSDLPVYGRTDILLGLSTSFCSGDIGTNCTLAHAMQDVIQMQYDWDATTNNWMVGYKGRNQISTIPAGGGTVNLFETTVNNINSFVFRRDGAAEYIYYCATNGKLYKRDVLAATESELPLPSPTMVCAGNALQYHATRDSLVFIYKENNLYGIAEYKNP